MTGYSGKLQGTPNASHVVQTLPPCSKPMPNGTGIDAPTWTSRHYDPPSSIADMDSIRKVKHAQQKRQWRERQKA